MSEEYSEGYVDGTEWAVADLANSMPVSDELARLAEESRSDARWARAFYLGALRGYREIVRTTNREGRWGT